MTKYLVILAATTLTTLSSTYAYNPTTDVSSGAFVNTGIAHPHYRESKKSYDLYISSGVYLFALNTGLQTIRNEKGTSARTLQSQQQLDLVINAGYFSYHGDTNTFKPAGRIVDGRRIVYSMVKEFWSKNLDRNLAKTIVYNKKNNTVRLVDDDLIVPNGNTYAFYAGPQMIQSGQVLTGINKNLSHRQRKTTRTFLIVDMDGNPHLGASITGYTLPQLAQKIQEMKVFYGPYHVINLDGGSSTSLAAGVRYWNSRARLPWFFGVK